MLAGYVKGNHPFSVNIEGYYKGEVFYTNEEMFMLYYEDTVTKQIDSLIQSKIEELNSSLGVSFKHIYSVQAYSNTPNYKYQTECSDLWDWQVSVWIYFREYGDRVRDGSIVIDLDSFTTNIPEYVL